MSHSKITLNTFQLNHKYGIKASLKFQKNSSGFLCQGHWLYNFYAIISQCCRNNLKVMKDTHLVYN